MRIADTPGRTGVTLVEVLVAIFVVGIGLIALLALFPLGVVTMAQAVRSDRAAHCAANAVGVANTWNLAKDTNYWTGDLTTAAPNPAVPALQSNYRNTYLFGSHWRIPSVSVQNPISFVGDSFGGPLTAGPSYPVYVDVIGQPVSAFFGSVVPRVHNTTAVTAPTPTPAPVQFQTPKFASNRWFTLLDEIPFSENLAANGRPNLPTGTVTNWQRDIRYSWAYLCQMQDVTKPDLIDLTVVVYLNRPLFGGTGETVVPNTTGESATFFSGGSPNVIQLSTASAPNIRIGSWVCDASFAIPNGTNPGILAPAPDPMPVQPQFNIASGHSRRHAFFYRVVNVTSSVSGGGFSTTVEVQPNLRGFSGAANVPGTLVLLDNVVEVFEKGTNPQW